MTPRSLLAEVAEIAWMNQGLSHMQPKKPGETYMKLPIEQREILKKLTSADVATGCHPESFYGKPTTRQRKSVYCFHKMEG